MKVLLISPMPEVDVACGDITYTQSLLNHPPPGVVYEDYVSALRRGTLVEHGRRQSVSNEKRPIHKAVEAGRFVLSAGLNRLRRSGFMFGEPWKWYSVQPGEYDVVHLHTFSARLSPIDCPLVVSNAIPQENLYRDAWSQAPSIVKRKVVFERIAARSMGVCQNSYAVRRADRLVAFTDHLAEWYAKHGQVDPKQIDVVPICIGAGKPRQAKDDPYRIGFIAKDFEAKGGPVVLEAFAKLRRTRPDAELVVVGSPPPPDSDELAQQSVKWFPYVPREQLLNELIPTFDILAYPTEFDGLPLVVLESLACGVPVATSDYAAMPEIVGFGQAGTVSPIQDANELAKNLDYLLDPVRNAAYRQAALMHFQSTYARQAVLPQLAACYRRAINERTPETPLHMTQGAVA
ncbi:MAG: glycosyltransferase family 4 protein [Planctomycetota bacterium]